MNQARVINNHLVAPLPSAAARQLFPLARSTEVGGQNWVALENSLETAVILQNMGIRAPSPIRTEYHWPGRFQPLPHQIDTAEFVTLNRRGYVLNDMGTMKTISTLWGVDYLMTKDLVRRVLIVAPLSTLERVWGDEIFFNFVNRSAVVLHGSRQKRIDLLAEEHDFYIINPDGLHSVLPMLQQRADINCIIVDEIAEYRNGQTQKWKQLQSLMTPERRGLGLTGTPTPQAPTDAHAQVRLLRPENVAGVSFTRFKMRTMHQITQFKWVPKEDAQEMVYGIMQPAIRFKKSECLNLPPVVFLDRDAELSAEQRKHYEALLKEAMTTIRGMQVSAVNAGVLLSKLVQVACIAYDTEVLTNRGWVAICEVTSAHKVWDGEEWVCQGGAIQMGVKETITLDGVRMTPEHKVWIGRWATAKEIIDGDACERFARPAVRLPDRITQGWVHQREEEVRTLVMSMRLRAAGHAHESVSARETPRIPTELRLLQRERDTQDVRHSPLPNLDTHATKVLVTEKQGLGKLWSAGHHYMLAMVQLLRDVLGGYAGRLRRPPFAWTKGQQRRLHPRELSLGNHSTTKQQQTYKCVYKHPEGADDHFPSRTSIQHPPNHTLRETQAVQVAGGPRAEPVYDLINCGPRSRFVVRGSSGELLIVHNCGVAYGDDTQECVDIGPRLKVVEELVEESAGKVLIFVPFTGALNLLAEKLRKRWSVEIVDGSVSKGHRDRIFQAFQHDTDPHIIVAHPKTMSHGLTLTAASTTIWYAPYPSNATYSQANERVARPGQTRSTTIVHISGTPVERRIYASLREKGKMQDVLLTMMEGPR